LKVSEITVQNVADYLRLETGEYKTTDIEVILNAAKAFIKSYTGIQDMTITGEVIADGDGVTTVFKPKYAQVVNGSLKVYLDGILKTVNTDYTAVYPSGETTFITAPTGEITVDYSSGIDAFEDFVIVVYVLCQDMYDNRSMYVEKNNLNKVVETILGMHCVNLL
jgi:hypothetical protein